VFVKLTGLGKLRSSTRDAQGGVIAGLLAFTKQRKGRSESLKWRMGGSETERKKNYHVGGILGCYIV
jgi:hypothetical protein